jgi:SAM-dependent methyltransferase
VPDAIDETIPTPTTATAAPTVVANHHADHPGFAGASGLRKALYFAAVGGGNARLACDLAGVGPGDHVVDIGCGPGTAVRAAAARGARATGVDPSPVMLTVARPLTARRRSSIRWAGGAAESIPVADADATVVWSVMCVHHWADIDAGLAEVHRVLAPGGRFLAVERRTTPDAVGTASHGWFPEQAEVFAAACRDDGFTGVAVSTESSDRGELLVVRAVRP